MRVQERHNIIETLLVLMQSPNKRVALKAGTSLDYLASRNSEIRKFILGRKDTLDKLIKLCGRESNSVSEVQVALFVRVIGCLAGLWPLNNKHIRILQCPDTEFELLRAFSDKWRTKKQECVGEYEVSHH